MNLYREYYGTMTYMFLKLMGIAFAAALLVWVARRYPKLPPRFERTAWLWIWGLNGVVFAMLGGEILYILVSILIPLAYTPNHSFLALLDHLDFTIVGFFLLATFSLVASGLCWRNFIKTWRMPRVAMG